MQAIPVEGRNTLVVYALEQHHLEKGTSKEARQHARNALSAFSRALLQQQPPVSLNEFLDRLCSPDPAERNVAIALRDLLKKGPDFKHPLRGSLLRALEDLSGLPRERRMLTLEQALHSKMQARHLKALMPEADRQLLQQVEASMDVNPTSAGVYAVILIRLGIALTAKGHGGLAGWLEMRNQPEGTHLANELLDPLKNGPELRLSDNNKRRFDQAVARLLACGLDEEGAASGTALAPRFPADFPPAEASLTNACLQAGLDKGLSRTTLYKYGRELIDLSEWLRKPADADRPAQPAGLQALVDLSKAGRTTEKTDLVAAFVATKPQASDAIDAAVGLLLRLPAPAPAPGSASTSASAAQPVLPSLALPIAAGAQQAPAGPATAASPSTSAWSITSAYEHVGGAEGIQAFLREVDEVMSSYRPDTSEPAGSSQPQDLDSLYRRLLASDRTEAFLQALGRVMGRAYRTAAAEASNAFEPLFNEFADELADLPATAPQANPEAVTVMSVDTVVRWFNNQLQNLQMAMNVPQQEMRREMRLFAEHLAGGQGESAHGGLNGFLQRYESTDPSLRRAARAELEQYLHPKGRSARSVGRRDYVVRGLELLAAIPPAQRAWANPARRISAEAMWPRYKPWLVPPQDRALLGRLTQAKMHHFSRFARTTLSTGQGGLTHWLLMFQQGQQQQARQMMLDFVTAERNRSNDSTAPSQDDALQGFAESLERSLMSPSPEPGPSHREAVRSAAASPTPGPTEDFILLDPGTPTADDLAFLAGEPSTTAITTAQPSNRTAPSQDDSLRGFAESLERSLMSPSPEPGTSQREAVRTAGASPAPGPMGDDFILLDPGTPTADDLAFLAGEPSGPRARR